MSEYWLVNWDDSRAGQTDQVALHTTDGTEIDAWGSRPTESQWREAVALDTLPGDANLPGAAQQATAMGVAAGASLKGYIYESTEDGFPPW